MSHVAEAMAEVKGRTEGFGTVVAGIDRARLVEEGDVTLAVPFLDGKPLDVDMAHTRSGTFVIDHEDGGHVIDANAGGVFLGEAKVVEDRANELGKLSGSASGN